MLNYFNRPPFTYWNGTTKISYLQRIVIVHSIIYYELNESLISDSMFDDVSRYLVELQKNASPKRMSKTQYGYCMASFDGNTGYDLYSKLNAKDKERLLRIANNILKLHKGEN